MRGLLGRGRRGDRDSQLDYLFVVTYGRSGSTLLQGLLNSLPGVLVRGENAGAVYELYRFHALIQERRNALSVHRMRRVESPWFGLGEYDEGAAHEAIRRLVLETVLRPEQGTRTVGFKEIRWNQPDLEAYVAFLGDVFPGARFVFNSRDLHDVARSGWWAEVAGSLDALRAVDLRHRELRLALGDAAFAVDYDDYRDDPVGMLPLVEWLGHAYDEPALAEVLARRHSWSGPGHSGPTGHAGTLKGA